MRTEQNDQIVDVPDQRVQRLGGDVLDNVLFVSRALVRHEPLEHILLSAQFI